MARSMPLRTDMKYGMPKKGTGKMKKMGMKKKC